MARPVHARRDDGITHLAPVCGESELCFLDECSSAVVEVATEPEGTS